MMFKINLFCGLLLSTLIAAAAESATRPPNVLMIIADDCTYNDLPLYGGLNAKTPHIDRLAVQSLVFNRAYLSEAMCQPCRAELYTGQHPLRNGCAWNHSASRPDTRSLPHFLSPLGYRVGIAGKVHVLPEKAFPFESVGGFDANCVRNPTQVHNLTGVQEFLSRDAQSPFCLVVALVEPHVPWVMGDPSKYPPRKITLPPNIADTPKTREDFGRYLAEITYMDGQVGEILAALDASGQADETIVVFTSEQGSQFPGCKWTNWETGIHTALIVRWPGQVTPGTRTDALVQYADLAPTLLEIAGGEIRNETFDGSSFASVLTGKTDQHRDYVYTMHNNIPEGPAYPIRSITNGEFHYILNLTPEELYIEKHLMGRKGDGALNNPYWPTWIWHAESEPETYRLVKRYQLRPREELYRSLEDPYEMQNLSSESGLAEVKSKLAAELYRWMLSQGDPGVQQDTQEAIQAARRGEHLFGPMK